MEVIAGALAIFLLRIIDVSIGTTKLLYLVRGQKAATSGLAFAEALVWVIAAALVFRNLDNLWNMGAFALGFAAGTYVGMAIEQWIGSGHVMMRIITRERGVELMEALKERGFGLTAMNARGGEGSKVKVVFLICRRKRRREALDTIISVDSQAFVTVDPVTPASGGYIMPGAIPANIRK